MFEFLLQNKELINILSGIGTFLSVLIAIYTISEIKKQRLSTYKPELIIKSFIVYLNKSPLIKEYDELIKYKVENFNEYDKKPFKDKNGDEYSVSPLYKIENYGFGPAKKISLIWKYDVEEAINEISKILYDDYHFNEFKDKKKTSFFEETNRLHYYFLNNKKNEQFQISFYNKKKTIQGIDYLPPINIKEHSHYHAIPSEIINSYFIYFLFANKLIKKRNKHSFGNEIKEMPKVSLELKYDDINGKTYIKNFEFKLSIIITQIDDYIDTDKEFAYLHFEIL